MFIVFNCLKQDIEDEDKIDELSKSTSDSSTENNTKSVPTSPDHLKSLTLPMKLDVKNMEWDELDELLQVCPLMSIVWFIKHKYEC